MEVNHNMPVTMFIFSYSKICTSTAGNLAGPLRELLFPERTSRLFGHQLFFLRLVLFAWLSMVSVSGHTQSSDILDRYIQEALANSLRIREAAIQLESKRVEEEWGHRLYLPELSFGTSYTLAAGGRSISFPVGDLLNPVYSTLNKLTQSAAFPSIDNVEEQFLPNNFYDARFRVRQPIIRAEIELTQKLQEVQRTAAEIHIEVLRRELIKEVKTAYFGYLQAMALLEVFDRNRALLAAQRTVQEGLIRNGKLSAVALDRNSADVARLEAQRAQVVVNKENAAQYFNFLLSRDGTAPIERDSLLAGAIPGIPENPSPRPELAQLEAGQSAAALLVAMEKAKTKPVLGAQLDYGSQGFHFDWGPYALLGISLEIPLWTGGKQKLQIQRARLESERLDVSFQQAQRAFDLEVQTTRQRFLGAVKNWESFPVQVEYAQRNYRETLRRYQEGVAGDLELQEAQTQWYGIEIQQTVAYYAVLLCFADLERAMNTSW